MKALSVSQPWASVLCSGIKDVENRTWQTKGAPGRILIHATKTKVVSNYEGYPDDYISTIKNARMMGQIPEYKEMPYGSIIGYLDCYQIVKNAESYWAQPDSYHWCVRDAYLFDEPIPDITGTRGRLFDVDVDENNLPPAHKVDILVPEWDGDTLVMPASKAVMEMVEKGAKEVMYDLDIFFDGIFCDPETGEPKQAKKVKFTCGDKSVTKDAVAIEIGPYLGPDGKTIVYRGFDGQEVEWSFLAIVLK